MKKVLSLLLAYALLQAQTWAIGGGPDGRGGGGFSGNLIGTYSGVLLPNGGDEDNNVGGGAVVVDNSSASIGLFSVAVTDSGPALGSAVVFVDGVAYIGNMIAVADPLNSTLTGIVEAQSNYSIITLVPSGIDTDGNITFETIETQIFIQGGIDTTISGGGPPIDPTVGATASTARLQGTAALDLFSELNEDGTPMIDKTVQFTVDGFKQSDTATTVTFDLSIDPTDNNDQ